MSAVVAMMVVILLALVGVAAWATVILRRTRSSPAVAPTAAPAPAVAAQAATDSYARSAQIDATRKALDDRAQEESALQQEMAVLAAAKSEPTVEAFVGEELSAFL